MRNGPGSWSAAKREVSRFPEDPYRQWFRRNSSKGTASSTRRIRGWPTATGYSRIRSARRRYRTPKPCIDDQAVRVAEEQFSVSWNNPLRTRGRKRNRVSVPVSQPGVSEIQYPGRRSRTGRTWSLWQLGPDRPSRGCRCRPRSAAEPGHGAISTGCPRARGAPSPGLPPGGRPATGLAFLDRRFGRGQIRVDGQDPIETRELEHLGDPGRAGRRRRKPDFASRRRCPSQRTVPSPAELM